MNKRQILFFILLVMIASPRPSSSWGYAVHQELTQKSISALPTEWSDYFSNLGISLLEASIAPDERRGSDPTEAGRHYDDQDIPHKDRNVSSTNSDYNLGVVAWAAENSTINLIQAFIDDNESAIIRYAGDVAHYVADAAQPLHATSNYDGQLSGNGGIHSRYESEMIRRYQSQLFSFSSLAEPHVVDDPYTLVEEQIQSGLELVPQILSADDKAQNADPKRKDLYYEILFNETRDMTTERLKLAAQNIANLWYTALVKSGRYVPPMPSSEQTTSSGTTSSNPPSSSLTSSFSNAFEESSQTSLNTLSLVGTFAFLTFISVISSKKLKKSK